VDGTGGGGGGYGRAVGAGTVFSVPADVCQQHRAGHAGGAGSEAGEYGSQSAAAGANGGGGAGYPKEPTAPLPRTFTVKWQAGDSNKDKLLFNLYLRPVGNSLWVRLEKDLDKPQYTWNSLTAADGRYEIKVEASDRADNSPAIN